MTISVSSLLLSMLRLFKRGGIIVNEHTLTAAQTRFHLQVLKRWFEFISLQQLPARLRRAAKKPFCLLTFDDGKRSNFLNAAPELERQGVPAVFYVPTDFLSNGAMLWFDRRERLVRNLGFCPPELELQSLKSLPLNTLTETMESWRGQLDFTFTREDDDDVRPMSWDEARSLHRRGFKIGAHGVTHTILTRESEERARKEIEQSLQTVSEEMGTVCDTFAFPNGNYSRELGMHAVDCGATTVMTTDPEWVGKTTPLWRLPRIQLFGHFSRTHIELKIALAAVRGALANPNQTGKL